MVTEGTAEVRVQGLSSASSARNASASSPTLSFVTEAHKILRYAAEVVKDSAAQAKKVSTMHEVSFNFSACRAERVSEIPRPHEAQRSLPVTKM